MISSEHARAVNIPAWPRALFAQAAGLVVAACICGVIEGLGGFRLPIFAWALAQGAAAAAAGHAAALPRWWDVLNFVFVPLLVAALSFTADAHWPAGAFVVLAAVYGGGTLSGRVPLFFSGRAATDAVAALLPRSGAFSFLDVGAGVGTALAALSRPPGCGRYYGVEQALLPFLVARVRQWLADGAFHVTWGDLWAADLSRHDVVYAYLSPVPMARLWEKAVREMRPGALFVSNSFAVPGAEPDAVVRTGRGNETIYVWRMQ